MDGQTYKKTDNGDFIGPSIGQGKVENKVCRSIHPSQFKIYLEKRLTQYYRIYNAEPGQI